MQAFQFLVQGILVQCRGFTCIYIYIYSLYIYSLYIYISLFVLHNKLYKIHMCKICKACVSLAFTLGACQDEDSTHMFTKIRKQVAWALTFRPSTAGSLYQLSNPMPDVAVIVLCVRVKTCIRQELAKMTLR